MYYPCSENKGADQLRGYREADLRLCFRICIKPVGTYLSSMKCIAVIMTSLIETFCYEAFVVGESWSRLDEAVLAGTHDRWFSRAKNGYHRFLLFIIEARGDLNVICVLL